MIVACPQCAARYRIDPSRVGPEGARLRCAKCESVFRVGTHPTAPAADAVAAEAARPEPSAPETRKVETSAVPNPRVQESAPVQESARGQESAPVQESAPGQESASAARESEAQIDRERAVLVAV